MDIEPKRRCDLLLEKEAYSGPWPLWTKRAGARLLRIFFPGIPTSKWLECFTAPDSADGFGALFDNGHIWGRMARVLTELRTNDPKTFEALNEHEWIKSIRRNNDGEFQIEKGTGIFNQILHHMGDIFEKPAEEQTKFWRSFSSGFGKKFKFRRQDGKAIRIYIFLIMIWPQVQSFDSMRELYGFVFRCIPADPCPEGLDPVDFEERQFKWFETLCRRNLGLTLRRRRGGK